ncbi:DUF3667 domain-containing protein [Mucilaginibacter sp. HD30]
MVSDINNCRSCDNAVTEKFCGNCGQAVHVKRVDFHYVWHEVQHLLHFEKGFLYTIQELLIRPGTSVKDFISFNRSRLVKPVIFLIIASLIYSTAEHFFHIEGEYINYSSDKVSATSAIFSWIEGHYGYANIMLGVFIAVWIKIFFKRYAFNLFEILILLCFAMGMGMLILAIVAAIDGLFKVKLMEIGGYACVLYCSWAIGNFFDRKKVMSYVKALIAYLFGMITFTVIALLVGALVDIINKH